MKDKIQNNVALLLTLIAAFIVVPIVIRLRGGVKNMGQNAINLVADNAVKLKYRPDAPTWSAVSEIVSNINDAFGGQFDEDENKAVYNLNGLKTKYQVTLASALYRSRYGRGLKEDSEKFLADGIDIFGFDLKRVNPVVRQNWF